MCLSVVAKIVEIVDQSHAIVDVGGVRKQITTTLLAGERGIGDWLEEVFMGNEELKQKITEVIDNAQLGSVATIKDGKPWVRYMAMSRIDDSMDIYSSSFAF